MIPKGEYGGGTMIVWDQGRWRPEGDPRKARNYVREAINRLLAGEKIEVQETRPYGCGIKYSN